MFIKYIEFDVRVSNILGQTMLVNKICRNYPLKIWGHEFLIDLMLLPLDEFDVILGMDWLTTREVMVSCKHERVFLKCPNGDSLCIEIERSDCSTNLISTLSAQKLILKGAEAFLAYILDMRTSEQKIDQVPTYVSIWMFFLRNYQVYHREGKLNLLLK